MNSRRLIADIASDWVDDVGLRSGQTPPVQRCERCAASDLLFEGARGWPHGVLHSLVAPIEEIVDSAVEQYLADDREERLGRVDAYRAQLRASARAVVDRALAHKRAQLLRLL